ncbi:MAG TPA: hypothetical protein VKP30_16550 [Polyangiaceae bacterium]|nr:hypothetical protein [Polyangiaceae bacterium]
MLLDLDSIDLKAVSNRLAHEVSGSLMEGYLEGKTAFRDQLVVALECSELEAEQLVDTLIAQGFLYFERALDGTGEWQVRSDPV